MRYLSGSTDAKALAGILAGVAGFQAALGAGAPWGAAAWGGANVGVLPAGWRVASAVSGLVLLGAAAAVSNVPRSASKGQRLGLTALTAYGAVGTAMNLISPSPIERTLWVPVSLAIAVLAFRARRGATAAPDDGLRVPERA